MDDTSSPKKVSFIRIPEMGVRYAMAYWKWVKAGKPVRDPDYIRKLFAICEQCPDNEFIRQGPDEGQCNDCTCYLKREGTERNKLAWPTEECDLGHWHADVKEPEDV